MTSARKVEMTLLVAPRIAGFEQRGAAFRRPFSKRKTCRRFSSSNRAASSVGSRPACVGRTPPGRPTCEGHPRYESLTAWFRPLLSLSIAGSWSRREPASRGLNFRLRHYRLAREVPKISKGLGTPSVTRSERCALSPEGSAASVGSGDSGVIAGPVNREGVSRG